MSKFTFTGSNRHVLQVKRDGELIARISKPSVVVDPILGSDINIGTSAGDKRYKKLILKKGYIPLDDFGELAKVLEFKKPLLQLVFKTYRYSVTFSAQVRHTQTGNIRYIRNTSVITITGKYKPRREAELKEYIMDNLHNLVNLSQEIPTRIDILSTPLLVEDTDILDILVGRRLLAYSFLNKVEINEDINKKSCMLDMLIEFLLNLPRKGKLARLRQSAYDTVVKQITELGYDPSNGMTARMLIKWIDRYGMNQINVYVIDPLMKVLEYKRYRDAKTCICMIISNGHVYGINDPYIRNQISRDKEINLKKIKVGVGKRGKSVFSNGNLV